jgi:hypothetical protein
VLSIEETQAHLLATLHRLQELDCSPGPVFVLTLQPLPGVDPIKSLRRVLKALLRAYGMRCVDLREERP